MRAPYPAPIIILLPPPVGPPQPRPPKKPNVKKSKIVTVEIKNDNEPVVSLSPDTQKEEEVDPPHPEAKAQTQVTEAGGGMTPVEMKEWELKNATQLLEFERSLLTDEYRQRQLFSHFNAHEDHPVFSSKQVQKTDTNGENSQYRFMLSMVAVAVWFVFLGSLSPYLFLLCCTVTVFWAWGAENEERDMVNRVLESVKNTLVNLSSGTPPQFQKC